MHGIDSYENQIVKMVANTSASKNEYEALINLSSRRNLSDKGVVELAEISLKSKYNSDKSLSDVAKIVNRSSISFEEKNNYFEGILNGSEANINTRNYILRALSRDEAGGLDGKRIVSLVTSKVSLDDGGAYYLTNALRHESINENYRLSVVINAIKSNSEKDLVIKDFAKAVRDNRLSLSKENAFKLLKEIKNTGQMSDSKFENLSFNYKMGKDITEEQYNTLVN